MAYNFTVKRERNDWEVHVDPSRLYGYFEFVGDDENRYVEGGLWFDARNGKLELSDFDGTFSLPRDVAAMLTEAGFVVSEEFTI